MTIEGISRTGRLTENGRYPALKLSTASSYLFQMKYFPGHFRTLSFEIFF